MHHHLSWLEAGVIGLLQGVSELFPVSSLGHSVLIPAVIGGSWARDLDVRSAESPYLAFIVGLHVATALALIVYFWRDWVRIVGGLATSIRHRRVATPDERLAWLLVIATIPVGLAGVLLEHTLRTVLAKPNATAAFLAINGLVLLAVERWRRSSAQAAGSHRSQQDRSQEDRSEEDRADGAGAAGAGADGYGASVRERVEVDERAAGVAIDAELATLPLGRAVLIGAAQIVALAPGFSRSGITMSAGLVRGLNHEQAARFAFLLATPVILAAGALKIPDLMGPLGSGIRGQVLFGSVLSFVGAFVSVRFLTKYFRTKSMRPFAIYCVLAGVAAGIYLNV